jgi:hypothetical protein
MPLQTTGYTANSSKRYLMDAGAVYLNLQYDDVSGEFTGELLGATSGGNEFSLVQERREIEVDGLKGRGMGNSVITSENPQLTVNLKELTARNLSYAIAGSTLDTSDANYDIITSNGKIELEDYLENVAFVGRITGSQNPVVIIVENVISMEGLTLNTQDDNEAVVPILFGGHYSQDNVELGTAPYKIYFPKEVVA